MNKARHLEFESGLTRVALVFTLLSAGLFLLDTLAATKVSGVVPIVEAIAFVAIVSFLIYGNVGYQLTRLGHLDRLASHVPMTRDELDGIHRRPAEPLLFLVPSYKEETRTVRQTLLSAAPTRSGRGPPDTDARTLQPMLSLGA